MQTVKASGNVAFSRRVIAPYPPVGSRQKDGRYFYIHEDDQLDEAQFCAWVKQASHCPAQNVSDEDEPHP